MLFWSEWSRAHRDQAFNLRSTGQMGSPACYTRVFLIRLAFVRFRVGMCAPHRVLIGHPFNPPHLVPLVEVVPGKQSHPEVVDPCCRLLPQSQEDAHRPTQGSQGLRRQSPPDSPVEGGLLTHFRGRLQRRRHR
jgi:hypothetical protein